MFFMLLACSDVIDKLKPENLRGRLSTVDLLIKLACFVKDENNVCILKVSLYKLVSARRSTVLSLSPSARVPCLS
jgi:hypothetical protein